MTDPKELYFEFLIKKGKHICVERKRIIAIEERYPDDLDFIKANDSKVRCVVSVQSGDDSVNVVESIEKYQKLVNRLYKKPFNAVK